VNLGSKGVWLGLGDPVRDLPRQLLRAARRRRPRRSGVLRRLSRGRGAVVPTSRGAGAVRRDPAFADGRSSSDRRAARAARSDMNFLWTTFTRFEPAADIHAPSREIVRNHIAYRFPS
jgi:hypothetical protein